MSIHTVVHTSPHRKQNNLVFLPFAHFFLQKTWRKPRRQIEFRIFRFVGCRQRGGGDFNHNSLRRRRRRRRDISSILLLLFRFAHVSTVRPFFPVYMGRHVSPTPLPPRSHNESYGYEREKKRKGNTRAEKLFQCK